MRRCEHAIGSPLPLENLEALAMQVDQALQIMLACHSATS
jgi:hypothetical protein